MSALPQVKKIALLKGLIRLSKGIVSLLEEWLAAEIAS